MLSLKPQIETVDIVQIQTAPQIEVIVLHGPSFVPINEITD
jgi:hypothetical protein